MLNFRVVWGAEYAKMSVAVNHDELAESSYFRVESIYLRNFLHRQWVVKKLVWTNKFSLKKIGKMNRSIDGPLSRRVNQSVRQSTDAAPKFLYYLTPYFIYLFICFYLFTNLLIYPMCVRDGKLHCKEFFQYVDSHCRRTSEITSRKDLRRKKKDIIQKRTLPFDDNN